jgi:hypothetical protein
MRASVQGARNGSLSDLPLALELPFGEAIVPQPIRIGTATAPLMAE